MKEKVLSIPTAFGAQLELYKSSWGKSGEKLSIVSGLQGDHLNGMYLNSRLSMFLDSVVEGTDPNYWTNHNGDSVLNCVSEGLAQIRHTDTGRVRNPYQVSVWLRDLHS